MTPAVRMPAITMNSPKSSSKVSRSNSCTTCTSGFAERSRRQARTTPTTHRVMQMSPLRSSYSVASRPLSGCGRKDATISSPTVSSIRAVGTSSSTCVSTRAVMGCFSFRNSHSSTSREVNAPSSTPQKTPGRPCIQKKSKKFISAKPPSRMLVVSPTSVAAPCRLEDTAMAMITGTGEIFSLRAMARPTGATMSTVATLSTNALMTPAKSASTHTAHWAFGTRTISCSARRAGIRLRMNSDTIPMVPDIISSTL